MQVWKLVVAYDGTDFHGWQVQPGVRTVQGCLAGAILDVTGERVLPQGSGRTDAGVHAEGQAVSVALEAPIPPERLRTALNRRLPGAVRVMSAEHAHADFHARARVVEKTYEYRVFARRGWTGEGDSTGGGESGGRGGSGSDGGSSSDGKLVDRDRAERTLPPWMARFAWDCRHPVSLDRMQAAAGDVVGRFDFSSFAAFDPDRMARLQTAQGSAAARTNVRTIVRSEWLENAGMLLYRVSGDGFLYHMVRNLVGTFIEIGMGRRGVNSLPALIGERDRSLAGPTAPPEGLFLMSVVYRAADAEQGADRGTDQGTVTA